MKICHKFNVKLVTSLPKKIQRVLSHGSQLGGKRHLWFLSMTSLKGDYNFTMTQEHFCGCTGWRLGMMS